ncbi:MAG TPA: hypothetical protein VLM11_09010 [Streptosporangiaceae bacterium]|nr:hypothetical protein [Streptosporangiaceae bacterium]
MGSRSRARARAQASQPSAQQPPAGHRTAEPADPANRREPAQLPRSVRAAATVEAIEAVALLVASVLAGIATMNGHSYQRTSGVAITIIGIATAIALALVARAVRAGRRWSRTPALLTQIFTGIVAIYLIQSGRLDWGVPTILLAIAGLAALLTPASIEVLTPGRIRKS